MDEIVADHACRDLPDVLDVLKVGQQVTVYGLSVIGLLGFPDDGLEIGCGCLGECDAIDGLAQQYVLTLGVVIFPSSQPRRLLVCGHQPFAGATGW